MARFLNRRSNRIWDTMLDSQFPILNARVRSDATGNLGTVFKIESGNFKCNAHKKYHSYVIHVKWDKYNRTSVQCSCDILDRVEIIDSIVLI